MNLFDFCRFFNCDCEVVEHVFARFFDKEGKLKLVNAALERQEVKFVLFAALTINIDNIRPSDKETGLFGIFDLPRRVETLSCLEGVVDFNDKVLLLLGSDGLGNGSFLSGLGCLAVKVVEQGGSIWQWEEDAALMKYFFAFSTVLFLLASSHSLGAVNDLVLGGALGRDNKGWLSLEVALASVIFCTDCGVDRPFFVLSVLNRDVLSDMLADHRLEI